VCDLETSRIGAPYIYDISNLRLKDRIWIFSTWVRQLKKALAKEGIKNLIIYRSSKHKSMLYDPSKQQCHHIKHTIRMENTYLEINFIY
jgi:hypothetical protein